MSPVLHIANQIHFSFTVLITMPSRADRERWNNLDKDVVVLHHLPRGKKAPSGSPFPLKLETFLRIADIKYENDFKNYKSPKGKTPWITVNKEDISDSQFAIEHLRKTLNKDINGHLSPEDAAKARALQVLADERFYWCIALDRTVYNQGKHFPQIADLPVPGFMHGIVVKLIKWGVTKQSKAHGIGVHPREQVEAVALGDIKAFSDYLGNKPFLMGDTPCEVDCSVFGMLVQALYNVPDDNFMKQAIEKDFKNLVDYVDRIKEKYWSDWEDIIEHGKKKEEEKKEEGEEKKEEEKKEGE